MKDINKCLQIFPGWELALKDPVVWQFDPDRSLGVYGLFEQLAVLLLPLVHELRLLPIVLHLFFEGFVVDLFVLVHLLFLVELDLHSLQVLRPNLEDLNVSVLDRAAHHFLTLLLLLGQHLVEDYWGLPLRLQIARTQGNCCLLVWVELCSLLKTRYLLKAFVD